jgi:hypothetical protein
MPKLLPRVAHPLRHEDEAEEEDEEELVDPKETLEEGEFSKMRQQTVPALFVIWHDSRT